jgi:hypothetical protein
VFFILFGVGLIAAIVNYASVFLIQSVVRNSLMGDEDPNDDPNKRLLSIANVVSLLLSIFCLIGAIVLVVWRASST